MIQKRYFIGFLMAVCLGSSSSYVRSVAHDDFTQATELYMAGSYQEALDHYNAIEDKDAAVLYNMGNSYFRLQQTGKALLQWRRAERCWPLFSSRRELLDNIVLVSHYHDYSHSYAISLLRSVPLIVLQLLFLCLWVLLFVYVRMLYTKNARGIIVLLFLAVTIVGGLLAVRYSLNRRNGAIVIESGVTMHSGPGDYPVIGHLEQAQEVVLKKEHQGYSKVSSQGKIGWVDTAHIEVI